MSVRESSEATVFMEILPVQCRTSPSPACANPEAPPQVDFLRNGGSGTYGTAHRSLGRPGSLLQRPDIEALVPRRSVHENPTGFRSCGEALNRSRCGLP